MRPLKYVSMHARVCVCQYACACVCVCVSVCMRVCVGVFWWVYNLNYFVALHLTNRVEREFIYDELFHLIERVQTRYNNVSNGSKVIKFLK